MEYKKSNYNLFVPYQNDEFIVFNAHSGSIGKFDLNTYNRFNNDSLTQDEIVTLKNKGILIDPDRNELDEINQDRISSIYKESIKDFRIWPTSACNARCAYCFEKGIKFETMTKDTADQTIKFIDAMLNNNDELHIEWFGGEPTLNPELIDYITKKIDDICRIKNVKVIYSMISNGSLINETNIDKIKNDWHLQRIQITLDGYMEDYDHIKDYVDKTKYNFNTVIQAIHLLADHNINVGIRMNYNVDNRATLKKLIPFLGQEFSGYKNIRGYLYPVWSSLIQDTNSFKSECVVDYEYLELLQLLVANKLNDIKNVCRLGYRKSQCHACHINGFAVFPDGSLGKCDETFTQKIGNIWDGVTDQNLYSYWTKKHIAKECESCQYMPLCQGGCASSVFTGISQCYVHKDILNDMLIWYISYLDEKLAKKLASHN